MSGDACQEVFTATGDVSSQIAYAVTGQGSYQCGYSGTGQAAYTVTDNSGQGTYTVTDISGQAPYTVTNVSEQGAYDNVTQNSGQGGYDNVTQNSGQGGYDTVTQNSGQGVYPVANVSGQGPYTAVTDGSSGQQQGAFIETPDGATSEGIYSETADSSQGAYTVTAASSQGAYTVTEDGSHKVGVLCTGSEEGGVDTEAQFDEIFQGRNKFHSWEDFITLFEAFQEASSSVFKPRSGTCVTYVNEKRVHHKIPERFIYQTVNMICLHYGPSRNTNPENLKYKKRKTKRSIGKNCGAYVKLSYKKGFLHITDKNLVHINHPLIKKEAHANLRRIRPVVFSDNLDLEITKCAAKNCVFESKPGDVQWTSTLLQLQMREGLQHLTMRMLKKRVNFLMDRFQANCNGREPLSDDEMGLVLYELQIEKDSLDNPALSAKKRKSAAASGGDNPPRRRSRRYRKAAQSYEEYVQRRSTGSLLAGATAEEERDSGDGSGGDDDPLFAMDQRNHVSGLGSTSTSTSPNPRHRPRSSGSGMSSFLAYWRERDVDERKLRWQEMQLRRTEVEIRRKEMELQRQKFEHEKQERLALMELLKIQGKAVGCQGNNSTNSNVAGNNVAK